MKIISCFLKLAGLVPLLICQSCLLDSECTDALQMEKKFLVTLNDRSQLTDLFILGNEAELALPLENVCPGSFVMIEFNAKTHSDNEGQTVHPALAVLVGEKVKKAFQVSNGKSKNNIHYSADDGYLCEVSECVVRLRFTGLADGDMSVFLRLLDYCDLKVTYWVKYN